MSGNTTRLGVDIANAPWQAALPLGLIAGFVAGVTAGAVLAERSGGRRKTAVLCLVTGLLVAAACLERFGATLALAPAVLAMGALNNVFRRNGEVAIGVTYMTGALVRFGQGLAAMLLRRPSEGRLSAAGLWLGLAGGALSGALVYGEFRGWSFPIAVAAAILLTLFARRIERSGDQQSI